MIVLFCNYHLHLLEELLSVDGRHQRQHALGQLNDEEHEQHSEQHAGGLLRKSLHLWDLPSRVGTVGGGAAAHLE